MSQTPQAEKKNRFQISREVQEEYVNGIADTMLKLAARAGEKKNAAAPLEVPFSAMTGKEFGGANMARLMLALEKFRAPATSMERTLPFCFCSIRIVSR